MKEKIGFIGLGMMGYPMAALLSKAGYSLWVADAAPGRVAQFCGAHQASVLDTDADDFPAFDVVITMLPNSQVVESVLLGADGRGSVVRHLQPGATVIDMSSSEPMRSRQLAATLAARELKFIDAPVSGGVRRAQDGSLTIMVGGDRRVFNACEDILHRMGKTLIHVGGPGAGHAVKALNNYVSAAGLIAAVEALRVGEAFGLDAATMTDVLNVSTGRNNTTENKVKAFMLNGAFNSGFSLQLMAKDLGTATKLGEELSCPMQLGDKCCEIWQNAADGLKRVADHTEMYRILEMKK
jgi:3-hydroxyisobutyrate dehydrogenase